MIIEFDYSFAFSDEICNANADEIFVYYNTVCSGLVRNRISMKINEFSANCGKVNTRKSLSKLLA